MIINLKKMAEDVFADVVYPSKGTEETFCDQHNRDLFLVLARKVAEAVKREDAATAEPIDDVLAGFEDPAQILDRRPDARLPLRRVTHAVGVERQQGRHISGGEDARRLPPAAELRRIPPDFLSGVSVHAHQLEIGVIEDATQRLAAGVAGGPLDHPQRPARGLRFVRHARFLPAGTACYAGLGRPHDTLLRARAPRARG